MFTTQKETIEKIKSRQSWVEKYRPTKLEDVVGNEEIIKKLEQISNEGNCPNMILAGNSGIGKTSAIYCLAKKMLEGNLKNYVLELNASDDRGIDIVRTKIKNFSQKSLNLKKGQHKIVILEEVDSMTSGAQQALRRIIENYSKTTRFFMTCNKSSKIIDPIQSRCLVLRLNNLTKDEMKSRLKFICKEEEENIEYTDEGLNLLVNIGRGDIRKVINYMESVHTGYNSITSENIYKVCDIPRSNSVEEIINLCIEKDSKQALKKVKSLHDQGYAIIDIIVVFFDVVCDKNMENSLQLKFIKYIGDTHMKIIEGRGSFVQLYGLIVKLCKC